MFNMEPTQGREVITFTAPTFTSSVTLGSNYRQSQPLKQSLGEKLGIFDYDKAKKRSDEKDKKNPDAGIENGKKAKEVTGKTPDSLPDYRDPKNKKDRDPAVANNDGVGIGAGTLGVAVERARALGAAATRRMGQVPTPLNQPRGRQGPTPT